MRSIPTTLLVITLGLVTQTARADGLVYQLPEDGAYVVYDLEIELGKGKDIRKIKGTLKMSSVGTVTEKDKKCRWVEIKCNMVRSGEETVFISKILVPEKNLKAGENAYRKKIRGWNQSNAGQANAMNGANGLEMAIFLCGPFKDAKKLKPVTVDSKLGKLDCEGVSGYTNCKGSSLEIKTTFKTRLHKKAPFGVVSTVMTIETNEVWFKFLKITLTLKEVGKKAKSELPDSK